MKKTVQNLLAVLLVFVLGFGCGWGHLKHEQTKNAEGVDSVGADEFDLRLPGEAEKRIVTCSEVEVQLEKIGQLAVYSGEYEITKSTVNTRYLLDDIPIFGTTNAISLECTGVVKVGFEMADIEPAVDNESGKIYISLPEPALLDNYVIWDSIRCDEENCILNPIVFNQYQLLVDEIEHEGLVQAEKDGLYSAAEENARTVIQDYLAGFADYEIVFL